MKPFKPIFSSLLFARSQHRVRPSRSYRSPAASWQRPLALCLLACGFLLGTNACQARPNAAQPSRIRLPIEVMFPIGTVRTVTVPVPEGAVSSLRLQIHGIEYAGQVSVQVNNTPWVALSNETCQVSGPGSEFGGIGGPVSTLTLTLPLAPGTIHAGGNQIRFRFDRTDGVNSGFRVLKLNLLDTSDAALIPASEFEQEDPAQWRPPLTAPADLAEGKHLWETTTLQESPLAGKTRFIKATCADCHARDGRDLKYFNFSNETIVARCAFHGLSEHHSLQIASYIRSLPYPAPGRPWNPPYQPGPGLDRKPATAWAAGAGFDAVLNQDLETLRFLFPNGITPQTASSRRNYNMRELPLALPLPDWNHWLATVHPLDFWGERFTSSDFASTYEAIRRKLQSHDIPRWIDGSHGRSHLIEAFYNWNSVAKRSFVIEYMQTIKAWTPALSEAVYSTVKWRLVKEWEIMQEFGLETRGADVYGPGHELRTWFSSSAFDTSPKGLNIPEGPNGIGGNKLFHHYFADVWYQLQVILNPGNGHRGANYPIDWPYVYNGIGVTSRMTQKSTAIRLLAYILKGSQESDNGVPPGHMDRGWNPSRVANLALISDAPLSHTWKGVPATVRRQILSAAAQAWLETNRHFTPEQYYTGGAIRPEQIHDPKRNVMSSAGRLVDQTAWLIPRLRADGVDPAITDGICDWAKTLWPQDDWDTMKHEDPLVAMRRR